MKELTYKNKNGKIVPIRISNHARHCFRKRYQAVFRSAETDIDFDQSMLNDFATAKRVENLNLQNRNRN